MDANGVIEAYVADVALRLPRRQRNDVAFELRALLDEELQERAEAAGRTVDATMAQDFLREFGHPAQVAARYLPTLTIIDPVDGRRFLQLSLIGVAIIWIEGLLSVLQPLPDSGGALLLALGHWMSHTLIPSLWWPGVLVTWYGLAARERRRPRQADLAWSARDPDRITGSRGWLALGVVGIACGLAVLMQPTRAFELLFGDRMAPAAYAALTYTDTFLQRQAPWLFGAVALNIPLLAAVIVRGRWSPWLRNIETALAAATCAVMVWSALSGPVFQVQAADRAMRFGLLLISAITIASAAFRHFRRLRPAPDRPAQPTR